MASAPLVELYRAASDREIELFKTAATFGGFALAVFCLACPLILAFAPNLCGSFRHVGFLLSVTVGFFVTLSVFGFGIHAFQRSRNLDKALEQAQKSQEGQ